jgi:hypothetical protein
MKEHISQSIKVSKRLTWLKFTHSVFVEAEGAAGQVPPLGQAEEGE